MCFNLYRNKWREILYQIHNLCLPITFSPTLNFDKKPPIMCFFFLTCLLKYVLIKQDLAESYPIFMTCLPY